jgi:hypothetical protein
MTMKQIPLRLASRECKNEGCKNPTPVFKKGDGFQYPLTCTPCRHALRNYGLTTPQRQELLDSQGGLCLCCGGTITFSGERHKSACSSNAVVDHCHSTGKVRGILCGNCNIVVGRLKDSLEHANMVVDYMEKHV